MSFFCHSGWINDVKIITFSRGKRANNDVKKAINVARIKGFAVYNKPMMNFAVTMRECSREERRDTKNRYLKSAARR